MNTYVAEVLITAGLVLASMVATADVVQLRTEHSCCLASEWLMPAAPVAPQSSDGFCCIANEWRANAFDTADERIESAVQLDADGCCLAREWHAS